MREAKRGFQLTYKHAACGARRCMVACLFCFGDLYFGAFNVPVAILVPDEFVERFCGEVETIRVEAFRNILLGELQAAKQPFIDERKGHRCVTRDAAILAFHIHQNEACGVPQLVAEVAIALAAREVKVQRHRHRAQRRKGKAHGVRTIRRNAVREVFANVFLGLFAVAGEHQTLRRFGDEWFERDAVQEVNRVKHVAL